MIHSLHPRIALPPPALVRPFIATAVPASPAEDDGQDWLSAVALEVANALEADAIMVAWHERSADPVNLFCDGDCAPQSESERQMITAASLAARGRIAETRSEWRDLGVESGGLLTAVIPLAGSVVTLTSMFRRIGASTRLKTGDTLGRLLPFVQPFFRLWGLRSAASSRTRAMAAAVNNADVGVALVSQQGELLFVNAAAETLIAQGDGLRRAGTQLSGTRLADTLRLQAVIEHVMTQGTAYDTMTAPVVALHRPGRRPILATVVAAEGGPGPAEQGAAVIYLFDPEQKLGSLIAPVCKLYGLSPVEAKLTGLIADGMTLADAAEQMRLREQTARSYLKSIFLKTDTRRQAELVWLMLKSAVRTAPKCLTQLV